VIVVPIRRRWLVVVVAVIVMIVIMMVRLRSGLLDNRGAASAQDQQGRTGQKKSC
jgi:hypothetical protein